MKNKLTERQIQLKFCEWLKYNYPEIIFQCDIASGMQLTQGQAILAKRMRSERGNPDCFIAEPKTKEMEVVGNIMYTTCGLFIELKRDDIKIIRDKNARKILKGETKLRKAGDFWDKHTEEQVEVMRRLSEKGYTCSFAIGLEDAKQLTINYLNL